MRSFALFLLSLATVSAFAAPISLESVQRFAGGIASSVQVSYASGAAVKMAQAVVPAEVKVSAVASTNAPLTTAFYVVDRGSEGGFVVLSADDRLDPVLVIAPSGQFDATPGTPLYDILCGDVGLRVEAADAEGAQRSPGWCALLDGDDPHAADVAYSGLSSISDVRVAPLVQSRWDQSTVGNKMVYNYFTPNHYVCGCVATAGSQIMRFHKYPTNSVPPVTHTCFVNGDSSLRTMLGGTYDWNNMPLIPNSSITDAQCQAIGKLCYDMGVAVYMSWTSGESGAYSSNLREAFTTVFGYRNAIKLVTDRMADSAIENAVLANLDAGYPVELGITGACGGHSIVGDGYGYSGGRLYVHLNMGWSGSDDAWYNLPNIGTWASFSVVKGSNYNIFPDKTGDLLTGRVLDSDGHAIANATVQAMDGSTVVGLTRTSASGIYALCLPGDTTYSVTASAAGSEPSTLSVYLKKSVSTRTANGGGSYYPSTTVVGNSWGNNFRLSMATEPVAPTMPTGVSASDGTSTSIIRITWNAVAGATYYKVYRSTSNSSGSATCIASSVTTSYYDDTTAEVGTTYYYWVRAGNASGESGLSSSDSGWRAYAVPSAPTNVSASDGTSSSGVVVSWSAVSSATSYSVWRATSSSSASATSIASGLTSTSYTDTSAIAGTTYYYWVKASNQGGTSGFSASDSGYRAVVAPAAPTGVKASDGLSTTEIVVSWNAVSSATSYSVWRATSSSSASATRIASSITTTSYSDASAVSGTTYYYWVKATNSGGTSGFSSSDTGYLAVITGPATVTASDGAYSGYVKVSWLASQNATSYEVWRGTLNAYSLASKIASPTSTSYNDTTATPGTLYYYWVRAVTAAGTSAFSASDSGYRLLPAPTGVSATTGSSTGVTVTWSAVTGATSYQVGRGAQGASAPADTLGAATSCAYVDATAVPGVVYAYFVRAVASAGSSAWSTSATGSRSVPTPTNLTATDGTYSDRILVTWPSLAGAQGYELLRADEDDIASAETIATTTATSFSDTSAEYGLVYYYFLRARFAMGTSPWSASEAGWRSFPAPTGVSAADGTSTSNIKITWNAIDGATLFQVWRYSDERDRNELIGTSTTTSYTDNKNIEPGMRYTYRVKAVFPTGTSAFSEPDRGYLKASSPTPVATDGTSTSQVSITWPEAAGAVAYLVYRSTSSSSANATMIGSTSMLYYYDTQAASGTLYYYWIRTATAVDTSDFGTADTGYVGLPGVSYVNASDGAYAEKVVVSWSAVYGAQTYEIWRGPSDESSGATRVAKGVTGSPWEDTGATPGAKCWYWVRACGSSANPGLWGASDSGWRRLSAPTDVTATTNQTDGVKVAWKGTTTGVSFEIRRGMTDDAGSASIIATVSGSGSYTDNSAVPGYVYYYWVRAYSELSESAWSSSAQGYRAVSAPAAVSATDGTSLDAVTVTWTAATSAKRYEIWRATTTKTTDAELIGTTNKLVWVDATAVPGTLYNYWIRSVSALDTSAYSNRDGGYVSTPPPASITASDGLATNFIRVAWTAASGALSYAVWRAESDNSAAAAQVKDAIAATTYDDTSATPGKYYWYWVRPVSAAGPGVFAGPDRGFASLSAPTAITASTNVETRVNLAWKKANGATSYEIFRAETNDVAYATNAVLATVTTTSYGDTNAVPAVRYWYWVRACAEADISPLGGPADGFRLLSVPTGIAATDGLSDAFVRVSWNETWGAASYEVWRAENSTKTTDATLLAGVTNALEYLDVTATAGISYSYWLKAVSDLHTTGFSAYDKGWRSLPAPSSVSASDGTTSAGVVIEWSAVDGATKYEIWRGNEATTNGAARIFTTTDASSCVYTNTSAAAGVKYWFWVRPVSLTGTGVFSASDDGFRAVTAPTNLKATDGTSYDYVRVTWSATAGAESYEVRSTATNELYAATTNFYGVTGTSFDDTNAVPGVIYQYSVRTISTLSTSDYAGPDDGYRKLQKINDVVAGDGVNLDAVDLSWTVPEGAQRCRVLRSTGNSVGSATVIATVEGATYADTDALHGVKYFYWVKALADVEGEAGACNDGWRALVSPETIAVSDGESTTYAEVVWSVSPDATRYEIFRGTSADKAAMVSVKTFASVPTDLVWDDTTAVPGTLYYYAVRAGGTGGLSELGAVDDGYRKLSPPGNVVATDGKLAGQVAVSWSVVPGATHYRVYRAVSDSAEKIALGGWQTGTGFTDTSCIGSTKYWYYVMAAVDETGSRPSGFSAGDSGCAKDDGTGGVQPVDLGGGISWPVTDNGDGTATTNEITYASIENGRLTFSGVSGAVGSTTAVYARVKTALDSPTVYTVPAMLRIVSTGTAELDLSAVWCSRPALFVTGITTEEGSSLP